MANLEHLKIFEKSEGDWNAWRDSNPQLIPDLSGIDLKERDLRNKDLHNVDLHDTNFNGTDIRGTDFKNAILTGADFREVKAGLSGWSTYTQIIVNSILGAICGYFSILAGAWFVEITTSTLNKLDITTLRSDVVFLLTGGMAILLIGVVIGSIRKGKFWRLIKGIAIGIAIVIFIIGITIPLVVSVGVITALAATLLMIVVTATMAVVAGTIAMTSTITIAIGIFLFQIGIRSVIAVTKTPVSAIVDIPIMMATAASIIIIAGYIGWRTKRGDPQFAILRKISLEMGTIGGTNFHNADLTKATFGSANLRNVRFSNATVKHTCWQGARYLDFAWFNGTILADSDVRSLLGSRDGRGKSFLGKDLHDAYLVGVDLKNADLSWVNLQGATLKEADLRGAKLIGVTALGTDFGEVDLTGACLEAWNIDSTTRIDCVNAEYIYLLSNNQERRPNSGKFGEGEFSKLFQEVLHTVDFIFKNGIDWQAFLITFDEIRKKVRVESEDADVTVQSIENKGEGVFVVKVAVSQKVDREELHRAFKKQYERQLAIQEAKYQTLLQGKEDLIAVYRQQAIDMKEIVTTMVHKQTVNITINQPLDLVEIDQLYTQEALREHYQLLSEKLYNLRKDYIGETDSRNKTELGKHIGNIENSLKKIDMSLTLRQQIVAFLKGIPNIHDSSSQQAFLSSAGFDETLENQLYVGKPPAQFIELLVSTCLKYGRLQDGRHSLNAVLEASRAFVGQDKKAYCDTLMQELENTMLKN